MNKKNDPTPIADLNDLLESERDALLKGDLERLGPMLETKETLIGQVAAMAPVGRDEIGSLDRKVRRNQLLLDGALEGIRAVATRLAAVHQTAASLSTYGSDGRKMVIDVQKESSVEKRA